MKIAILTCGTLPIPAVQGGAVENLIDFYLDYNNRKHLHDITIYSPKDNKTRTHPALSSKLNHFHYIDVTSLKARIERKMYKFFHSDEYYNYFIEYYFEKAYAHIKSNSYDLIILENCPGHAYKLSQRGYKNLILHLHNDLLNSGTRYCNEISKSITKVLTVSDYIKDRVSTILSEDKIETIYNGIDLKSFSIHKESYIKRKKLGLSEDDFVIIYNGRLIKEKGVYELTKALLLLQDVPRIKLMIVGSTFFEGANSKDAFLNQLKKESEIIRDKIIFTGYIPYNEMPSYLHLADIAVLPSIWEEPFGLTIVEAMAAGLPLITTRSGGIPEICEGVATIVEKENVVNNLVSAIRDLYNNPEKRVKMSAASIERAKLFDKEAYSENFFNAIENIK
ncbi:MAG: glycosyltransferase family 4 protein [Prevotella sp.]|nr:glycosyltransferase family 4 protein [Prevotella sp.]